MKAVVKKNYHMIKDIYRYLAGQGRENLYQISFNVYTNFMAKTTQLID